MRLLFAAAAAAAVIAPLPAFAVSGSTVSIGNTNNAATATVTSTHQLETTLTAPNNVVVAGNSINANTCGAVYTPPAGKAIMVTEITYVIGAGTTGANIAELAPAGCGTVYDLMAIESGVETQSHTFPTGLPMPNVYVANTCNCAVETTISGYLIPATALPPSPPQGTVLKGFPRR